jgi:eukaryotic-like serine/threonine-protein kinase
MQTFRLFVSSPADAMVERRRVENVVSRLNGEFAGVARLETIRWETEFYQAYRTFQAQIPHSTDCELVVGILRWRLGTELPPDFAEKLPGNEPFPSGTAYEILTAVEQRQKGKELPDIYVFRFAGGSPPVPLDDPNRAQIERDWQALKNFFAEWFLTPRGHFRAAFNQYNSEDDLEAQLEKLLRKWVADKVAGGRMLRWPIAVMGSPFCGLAAFGAKHAPVFFGRSDDISRAVDLWREAGNRGSPYLLVVGASGSGKSSLARAGLLPRLSAPGVIKEVDAWRVAVIRPGDSAARPFVALAQALMQDEAGLPKEEEGRGPALPEIGQGDSQTPADLAVVLQHADSAAIKPIVNVLSRLGTSEHNRERYSREVRWDLVLLIDQLEELFAASVDDAERNAFIDLIAALVGTGRVWVVATLRADFYARMLVQPGLKKLKELGATYDLSPPGPVELAEIVRGPADAAGLIFETDAVTGERLDTRLLRDADRPDILPLVQLALSRLFDGRELVGGETVLPLKVYETLGGLKGIVNEAGEKALASLGGAEKAQLPRLLRQLAVPAHDQDGLGKRALTIRALPLAEVAPQADEPVGKLVTALIDARLLTTTGTAADAQVRLTHQRVLEDWSRARSIVAESADFYRIRAELEESRRKWEAGKRRNELLLPRGLPLAEAVSIVGKYGNDLTPEALAYVGASRKRALRSQMIGWAVAMVFLLLAIGASLTAKLASDQRKAAEAARVESERQTQRADRNFSAAQKTVDGLVFNIAEGLSDVVGMPVATIKNILNTVQQTIDQLLQTAPDDPKLLRTRGFMLYNFAQSYAKAGDLKDALAAAAQSDIILRRLAAQKPDNAQAQRDFASNLKLEGFLNWTGGDLLSARAHLDQSLEIHRRLLAQDPKNTGGQLEAAVVLVTLGVVRMQLDDLSGALAADQEGLTIQREIARKEPNNTQVQRDMSLLLTTMGNLKKQKGDLTGALAHFEESLALERKLATENQYSLQEQSNLGGTLSQIGTLKQLQGDLAEALTSFEEGLSIVRALAAQDRSNAMMQGGITEMLDGIGSVKLQQGDLTGALSSFQQSVEIHRRLAAQDQENIVFQRSLSVSLNQFGDLKLQQSDLVGAQAAYQESLDIASRLALQRSVDVQAQLDLSSILNRVGDTKLRTGNLGGALAHYEESLKINRKAANQNQGNADALRDISISLGRIGTLKLQKQDFAGALAAVEESTEIDRKLVAEEPTDAQVRRDLMLDLGRLGDIKLQESDFGGALVTDQESLDLARELSAHNSRDAQALFDLCIALNRVGNAKAHQSDQAAAIEAFQESLAVSRRIAAQYPGNKQAQRYVVVALASIGGIKAQQGDLPGALSAFEEDLNINHKLASEDPNDAQAQRDLGFVLDAIGYIKVQQSDLSGALSTYEEKLNIDHRLATEDKANVQVQLGVSADLDRVGYFKLQRGDLSGALSAYQESLDIRRKFADQDQLQNDKQFQHDLAATIDMIGETNERAGKPKAAVEAYRESLAIVQRFLARKGADPQWRGDLNDLTEKIGGIAFPLLLTGDFEDALLAVDQAISLAPDKIWLCTNRAHALMFLTRTDEARALYLKYRGQKNVSENKSWDLVILDDFAQLRKAGLANPLMDEIEKLFRSAG